MGKVLKAWGGWGTQTEVYFPGNPRSHVLLKQYATEGLGDLKHTVGTIDGAGKAEGTLERQRHQHPSLLSFPTLRLAGLLG